jgi:hypothetical protein
VYIGKQHKKNSFTLKPTIMKTQIFFKTTFLLFAVAGMLLSGCRKDDNPAKTDNLKATSQDEVTLKAADEMATNDVNKILGGSGTKAMLWAPCNATLDSTFVIADTVTYIITYNGLNCEGNYSRTGTVEAHKSINSHWSDAGAAVYIKYVNMKITRVSDGRWATVNGTKRFSNESGGTLAQLGSGLTSVTHKVGGSLTATFDDNTTRAWNVARMKVYTGTLGNLIVNMTGLGSADGYTGLESWGVNRHGDNYYNSVTSAVVFKETCNWEPISGGGIISIPDEDISATITFGYDSNSTLVDMNGSSCATHYRVDWTKGNRSGTFYVAL